MKSDELVRNISAAKPGVGFLNSGLVLSQSYKTFFLFCSKVVLVFSSIFIMACKVIHGQRQLKLLSSLFNFHILNGFFLLQSEKKVVNLLTKIR